MVLRNAFFRSILGVDASTPIRTSSSVLGRRRKRSNAYQDPDASRNPPQQMSTLISLTSPLTQLSRDAHCPLQPQFYRWGDGEIRPLQVIHVHHIDFRYSTEAFSAALLLPLPLNSILSRRISDWRLWLSYTLHSSSLISLMRLTILKPSPKFLPLVLLLPKIRP